MKDRNAARLRRGAFVLGGSLLAIAIASPASAQCSPDPTSIYGTTNCTGTDSDGLSVSTIGTSAIVASGATVQPGAGVAAITLSSLDDQVIVNGTVAGGSKPGIAVIAGPMYMGPCDPYAGASPVNCSVGSQQPYYPSASAYVSIAAGATVSGSQALLMSRDSTNTIGNVSLQISNAGTLTGTNGPAVVNGVASYSTLSVTNLGTGWIGGITGATTWLNNSGTVDGGANAALATTTSGTSITNTSQILSSGSTPTVSGTGALDITNSTGGTIGGSATAILSGGALTLTNDGTINGSVISTAVAGQDSVVDTRKGVINGDLILGAGNDTVRALFDSATGHVLSVTGAIDGGAGTDTLAISVAADATFGSIVLPNNFELLGVDLSNNATVTLSSSFTTGAGISIGGYGTVINKADLTTAGPAVTGLLTGYAVSFVNQGSITATLSGSNATAVSGVATFTNSGSITANGGNGVQAGSNVTNSGAITATGTAITAGYSIFDNSGTIRSTGGIGAILSGASATNRGTITGATTGVSLGGSLTNSGTITGGATGVALDYSATLINAAGGTIVGGVTNEGLNVRVANAGTINGNVNLVRWGYDSSDDIFVDAGGTVNGSINLGGGNDQLIVDLVPAQNHPFAGATGGVDAGDGYDTLRYRVNADASASLALSNGFEGLAYELDNKASLTLTAASPFDGTLGLVGNGKVTLNGTLSATDRSLIDTTILTTGQLAYGNVGTTRDLTIVNNGALTITTTPSQLYTSRAAVLAYTSDVTNNGTITVNNAAGVYYPAAAITGGDTITNTGTITMTGGGTAINGAQKVVNSGTITDTVGSNAIGVSVYGGVSNSGIIRVDGNAVQGYYYSTITNSGTIESRLTTAIVSAYGGTLTNEATGTIRGGTKAIDISSGGSIINRGTIIGDISSYAYAYGNGAYLADGGHVTGNITFGPSTDLFVVTDSGTGVSGVVDGGDGDDIFGHLLRSSGTVSLATPGGVINFENALVQVAGSGTTATITSDTAFSGQLLVTGDGTVVNKATITGGVGTWTAFDVLPTYNYSLASFDNQGTITGGFGGTIYHFSNSGSISAGADSRVTLFTDTGITFANSGAIVAPVLLQSAGLITVQNSGTISATGTVALSFYSDTPTSATVTNTAGGRISSNGTQGVAISTYNTALTLDNAGIIDGAVITGSRNDAIVNGGTINGPVFLGDGDDSYTELPGSVVTSVDGGAGIDLYRVRLSSDRSGINPWTNFEQLAVEGSGTLALTLSQNYQSVALAGANLNATLAGFTINRIDGSAAAEQVTLDGDVAAASLGGGNDTLLLATTTASGRYDGGDGTDALRFTLGGPVTLTGRISHFETLSLAGNALTVAGTLGSAGDTLSFGDGAQSLTLASGGTIAGTIDLGAGDDSFRLAPGGTLLGTVSGGAGSDTVTVALDGGLSIGALTGFEHFVTEGSGTLTLTNGVSTIDRIDLPGDLVIAAGASLATQQLHLSPTGSHLGIAGGFTGAIVGSAGADSIDISGGTTTAPVAITSISDVDALRMSAGLATISGNATIGSINLSGGRLVGLAGSTIAAPSIVVGSGATFGSAGTVNGNLTVNGTLSPGASPGTMTVNGNVALAGSSISLFELTPAVSDKLVINGTLSIAQGATLKLVADQTVTPGKSLDLIVASGGITGSYTNILKPASVFGLVVQQGNTISLLGQFATDPAFSPQVKRSISYVNDVLMSGHGTAALITAAPQFATATGASNAAAFAQLTPEAYASAGQVTVEQGLELADAGRGSAFAAHGDAPGLFTFASTLGDTRTLQADAAQGISRAQTHGYGFLGGIGWGSAAWSVGGFIGYLDSRQTLSDLGARTRVNGVVAGLQARWTDGRWGLKATIAYDGGEASTSRTLIGGAATGAYSLHGWTIDASADYVVPLSNGWTMRPSLGVTTIRASRDRTLETGGNAFALDVAQANSHATFIDGAVTLRSGVEEAAVIRPYVSVGLRHQVEGRTPSAIAALGGGSYGLVGIGARRAATLATAALGSDFVVSPRLVLFGALSGEGGTADHRASARGGLRLTF